ncbi:MAG: DNA-directed RNA polymerase subunit omega [Sphingobacteriia bacterium]|nr:DNA-directed RNA polymerase subunit omega [Sphingobacteriia bacterium]
MDNPGILPLNQAELSAPTGNVYKTIAIIGKRAQQISNNVKEELASRLANFAPASDNLEEITENREQIEISRYYERQMKPGQQAIEDFMSGNVYFRDPHAAE